MVKDDRMLAHDDIKGWHLDKRIGVAHLLTTASFLFGFGAIMWALESRVTVVEHRVTKHEATTNVEIKNIKQKDLELMSSINRQYIDIKSSLSRIEDKIERHQENASAHGNSQ